MMTITEFLNARYDEEEAVARAADIPEGDAAWIVHGPVALSDPRAFRVRTHRDMVPVAFVQDADDDGASGHPAPLMILDAEGAAAHIALHDPARVLADIAAKRALLQWLDQIDREADQEGLERYRLSGDFDTDSARHILAQPYAEHADFDPAWRT